MSVMQRGDRALWYLFGFFSILAVLVTAVDVPPDIINTRKVSWTFLLLQLGQDRRLSLWEGRHLLQNGGL